MKGKAETYAGDAAWKKWFKLCSVPRCGGKHASALANQVRSAMFAQLGRFGFPPDAVEGDDPVTFFDNFFMAKGTRDPNKPLKSYLWHKKGDGDIGIFVCGTLFSAKCGRIHDIVREWIASVKGWKPHSLVGADGQRHLQWESAATEDDVRELAGGFVYRAGSALDRAVMHRYAAEMLDAVALKMKVEKRKVAFLLNAVARGTPTSSPEVLAALGVKKSQAQKIKEKCMKEVEKFFAGKDVDTSDVALAKAIIAVCENAAGKDI